MKTIAIKDGERFKTADVIKGAVSQAANGMNLTQMRSRVRILDALDVQAGRATLKLEDADYTTLKEAVEAQPWVLADRELLGVIDGIMTPLPETPEG